MPNYWGRMGAPMIQPTKDELRRIIYDQQNALAEERVKVIALEASVSLLRKKLDIAQHKLGEIFIESQMKSEREQRLLPSS